MKTNTKTKKTKRKIQSYLSFTLDNEKYAIHVSRILSIVEMHNITKVPKSEAHLKGVINLRGEIIPVIDSHIKFKLSPATITMKTSILILEINWSAYEKIKLGLMIDKIDKVIKITKKQIIKPPKIDEDFKNEYVTGMYESDDGSFIMILDIEKALSLNNLLVSKKEELAEVA